MTLYSSLIICKKKKKVLQICKLINNAKNRDYT